MGIVSDLAQLKGDTRYLLQKGLECLHQTSRLGLKMLMENVGLMSEAYMSEEHIGFVIGPRLNALGRLGDDNRGVEFLTTGDKNRAKIFANELEELNAQRQFLTNQVFQGAMQQIERDPGIRDGHAIVLCHPEWPAGVIGIVAKKLVEHFNKPVVMISNPPGEIARGSARSIEGVNITQAIATTQILLHSYGGHPMAAGLSLSSEDIPKFRKMLSQSIKKMTKKLPQPKLHLDGYQNGRIAGAALDVFEADPLPQDSPLRKMSNVLLAPHNANSSPAAWERVHHNTIRCLLEGLGIQNNGPLAIQGPSTARGEGNVSAE